MDDKLVLGRRIVMIDKVASYDDLRRTVRWSLAHENHVFDLDAAKVLK
jgi:hypothetical protein